MKAPARAPVAAGSATPARKTTVVRAPASRWGSAPLPTEMAPDGTRLRQTSGPKRVAPHDRRRLARRRGRRSGDGLGRSDARGPVGRGRRRHRALQPGRGSVVGRTRAIQAAGPPGPRLLRQIDPATASPARPEVWGRGRRWPRRGARRAARRVPPYPLPTVARLPRNTGGHAKTKRKGGTSGFGIPSGANAPPSCALVRAGQSLRRGAPSRRWSGMTEQGRRAPGIPSVQRDASPALGDKPDQSIGLSKSLVTRNARAVSPGRAQRERTSG